MVLEKNYWRYESLDTVGRTIQRINEVKWMDIIEEILDKYFDEEHEYYHRYREDEENYYDVVDELKQELTKKNISFKLDVTDAFDSPGYECSVLSIAYIKLNNNWGSIELETVLLESM